MRELNTRRRSKKSQLLPIILLAILFSTVTYTGYALTQSTWPFIKSDTTTDSNQEINNINLDPPTEQEVVDSQNAKKRHQEDNRVNSESAENQPQQNKKGVSVGVSFSSVRDEILEIRAFTNSVIEGDGKCKATLTKGDLVVVESSEAFIDSRSSICQPIMIPVSSFPERGEWIMTVEYTSSLSNGKSGKVRVSIL